MKTLRKQFVIRTISIVFIFFVLSNVMLPTIAYAITLGPTQPEFTSYEEPGASDMVNMGTGDFTFSLPVLEVPGPEGSFSLPLTYNGGIGLDQEASWVGLGWTMNAGAITRSVNQFPDDANGESQVVTVQDLTGLRGWDASILGVGKFGWNNQVGHFGNLSILGLINSNWTNDFTSVGIAGINVTSDGVKGDPFQMAMAAVTLISWGATGAAAAAAKQSSAVAIGKQIATDAVIGVVMDGVMSTMNGSSPSASTDGYWEYSKKEKKNWGIKNKTGLIVGYNEYKIWLDKTRTEDMYGTLYVGNAPIEPYINPIGNATMALTNGGLVTPLNQFTKSTQTLNKGAASDITYIPEANEDMKQFSEVNNPVTLAFDNYSVKAPGVSGSITPYRLEIGSVSMPREMTSGHERLAALPFLSNNPAVSGNYKVPFIYNGQLSNSYFHHVGSATTVTSPTYYLGVSAQNTAASGSQGNVRIDLNDVIFKNERIKSSIPASKKIPQSRYIEWHTNDEIRNGITYNSRYLDFLNGGSAPSASSDRYKFRTDFPGSAYYSTYTSTNSFSTTIPVNSADISKIASGSIVDLLISFYNDAASQSTGATLAYREYMDVTVQSVSTTNNTITFTVSDSEMYSFFGKIADIQVRIKTTSSQILSSIGSFTINGPDGTTYHFGLPLYDYDNYTEIRQVGDPTNKRSIIRRNAQYATAWLLTAITGPDFIDRTSNGMVDETDWGSWVKFNYGRHMDNYEWRIPYTGYKKNPEGTHESYTTGKNHLYYLNTIETRSHVALFQKSLRLDGKSAKVLQAQYPLKLDEISLITREQYNKLISSHGMMNYSNQVTQVLLAGNLSASAINYIKANCTKRIRFIYNTINTTNDFSLCPGVPNSSSGKLTLTRLSILGRNDQKTVPDYKFEYGYNPSYNVNHWDGYGMYNPDGTDVFHDVSQTDLHGSAWSLTKITNPLGSEILVNYERDDYSTVSGDKIMNNGVAYSNSNTGLKYFYPIDFPTKKLFINHNNLFAVGDVVRVDGFTSYLCPGTTAESFRSSDASHDFTITEVGTNYIKLDTDFIGIDNCGSMSSGQFVEIITQFGVVRKVLPNKKGGEVRTASIVTTDDSGVSRKIRYLYVNDDGTSSGVISTEPDYVGGSYKFYDIPGYPQTPVMYGKVSVLTGPLTTDLDYDTRQTFEFETPHQSLYTVTQEPVVNEMTLLSSYNFVEGFITPVNYNCFDFLSFFHNKIEDRTSKIGRLKAVKIFNRNNILYSSAELQYTDQIVNDGTNNYQGIYSNGALMFDRVYDRKKMDNTAFYTSVLKMNRTTKLQFPSALLKTINYKDGFTSESTNLNWDLYTGNVLTKLEKSPLGVYMKSVSKPAYTAYPELGPRALNEANKNMLSQSAASYAYRTDASGNVLGLTSASVTTWNKTWSNYRTYNSSTQTYSDNAEGADIWRKGKSYVFKGNYARKNPDGTLSFQPGDEFNFGVVPAETWQYTGEFEKFDHYGMPLQTKDMNAIYSTTKLGYDNTLQLMSASNAKYTEAAFSSAEDLITGVPFFGGEVGLGSGTVVYKSLGQVPDVHTGDAAVALSTGYSFVFKPTGLSINRTYRAGVWTNSTNGRIYYKLNGGAEVLSNAPVEFVKIGSSQTNWYRINLTIPVGATFTSLEVGVKSATGATVLFDDFRFHPLDGGLTGYVYNPNTKVLEYVLDNDNVFTQYEYNDRGQLIKTYREILKYNAVKLISQSNSDFKRFHFNQ